MAYLQTMDKTQAPMAYLRMTDKTQAPMAHLQTTDKTQAPMAYLRMTDKTQAPMAHLQTTDKTQAPMAHLQTTDKTQDPLVHQPKPIVIPLTVMATLIRETLHLTPKLIKTATVPPPPPTTGCRNDDVDCIMKKTKDISKWYECPSRHGDYPHPQSETATADSDVVQSGRPIFDDFFQHLWPYIGNNTANGVFQMVKRLWLIRIDQ
ncbi:hypothetical protein TNCV_1766701 [Trichonephila clavipes]|nr:hypothetical protein TNCV_1766701 [Trichonephila clavipes]